MNSTYRELLTSSRIIVVVGAGGTGKTSIASATGLAAARLGRRVCVVTVDPARRLADALGGAELGADPRLLPVRVDGELWAMMLDPAETFDAVVRTHATSDDQAAEILANPFYRRLSTSVPGVHEYMAVEQVYRLACDDRFDLVVVDTPPSRHALDIVDAPERLSRFLDNPMYRTLIRPSSGLARLAARPARALTRRISTVVGGRLLDDALSFFEGFAGMEAGFVERASEVRRLLDAATTAFVVVATPRRTAVDIAATVTAELALRSLRPAATVANMVTFDPWPRVQPALDEIDLSPEMKLRLEALTDRHHRAVAEQQLLEPFTRLAPVGISVRRRPGEITDLAALDLVADELAG